MVEWITDAQGEVVKEIAPEIIAEQNFDPAALDVIREGMYLWPAVAGSGICPLR